MLCSSITTVLRVLIAKHMSYPADGAGFIDHEELAPLLRELGISVSAAQMQELFPRLDLDASGDIGRDELATWVVKVI